MQRRHLLRTVGASLSLGVGAAVAGCSSSSDSEPPITGTITGGPYVWKRQYRDNLVYVTLKLEGDPDDWPEISVLGTTYSGYTGKMTRGDGDNSQDMTVLHKSDMLGWTTTNSWIFEKSEFENDGVETERIVLGYANDLTPGTEFTFSLRNVEAEKIYEVGSLTYEGTPTERTPSK
ncbi:hypothetical protein [Salinibaculum rarum]|uniref:hypothetical protein n=1 Tax=Salinibaculum rarum TaxID=3058903 RepID=UPI00265E1968|nr:hypothetical protein [Salinibaculum sp. KK48]